MESLQVKIAKRAYELFQARGGQHGYHIDDWLQAEKEIVTATAAHVRQTKPTLKATPAVGKAMPAASSTLRKKR